MLTCMNKWRVLWREFVWALWVGVVGQGCTFTLGHWVGLHCNGTMWGKIGMSMVSSPMGGLGKSIPGWVRANAKASSQCGWGWVRDRESGRDGTIKEHAQRVQGLECTVKMLAITLSETWRPGGAEQVSDLTWFVFSQVLGLLCLATRPLKLRSVEVGGNILKGRDTEDVLSPLLDTSCPQSWASGLERRTRIPSVSHVVRLGDVDKQPRTMESQLVLVGDKLRVLSLWPLMAWVGGGRPLTLEPKHLGWCPSSVWISHSKVRILVLASFNRFVEQKRRTSKCFRHLKKGTHLNVKVALNSHSHFSFSNFQILRRLENFSLGNVKWKHFFPYCD